METLITPDELYVLARRVLLDALDALGDHRNAIILVGAQAVYLRVGEGDVAVAPFTIDGDLAVDPAILALAPPLELALRAGGFTPQKADSVGVWIATRATRDGDPREIAIDLLVPRAVSPEKGTARAARLRGHDPKVARLVSGLDGAIVDTDVISLPALDPADRRAFEIRVAGPAALLVAKAHKIADRIGSSRLSDKDDLDVFRLLRGTTTEDLVARFVTLLGDTRSEASTRRGLDLLRTQFEAPGAVGVKMAVRATDPLMDPDEVEGSLRALVADLIAAMTGQLPTGD